MATRKRQRTVIATTGKKPRKRDISDISDITSAASVAPSLAEQHETSRKSKIRASIAPARPRVSSGAVTPSKTYTTEFEQAIAQNLGYDDLAQFRQFVLSHHFLQYFIIFDQEWLRDLQAHSSLELIRQQLLEARHELPRRVQEVHNVLGTDLVSLQRSMEALQIGNLDASLAVERLAEMDYEEPAQVGFALPRVHGADSRWFPRHQPEKTQTKQLKKWRKEQKQYLCHLLVLMVEDLDRRSAEKPRRKIQRAATRAMIQHLRPFKLALPAPNDLVHFPDFTRDHEEDSDPEPYDRALCLLMYARHVFYRSHGKWFQEEFANAKNGPIISDDAIGKVRDGIASLDATTSKQVAKGVVSKRKRGNADLDADTRRRSRKEDKRRKKQSQMESDKSDTCSNGIHHQSCIDEDDEEVPRPGAYPEVKQERPSEAVIDFDINHAPPASSKKKARISDAPERERARKRARLSLRLEEIELELEQSQIDLRRKAHQVRKEIMDLDEEE